MKPSDARTVELELDEKVKGTGQILEMVPKKLPGECGWKKQCANTIYEDSRAVAGKVNARQRAEVGLGRCSQ